MKNPFNPFDDLGPLEDFFGQAEGGYRKQDGDVILLRTRVRINSSQTARLYAIVGRDGSTRSYNDEEEARRNRKAGESFYRIEIRREE